VHLQKSLRENNARRGYEAQTATRFLQSKTQHMPGRAISNAMALGRTGSEFDETDFSY
jgi:hypothetical protein